MGGWKEHWVDSVGRVHRVVPFWATKQQKCPIRRNYGDRSDPSHSSRLPNRIRIWKTLQKHTFYLSLPIRRGHPPGAIHFFFFVPEFSARRRNGRIPSPLVFKWKGNQCLCSILESCNYNPSLSSNSGMQPKHANQYLLVMSQQFLNNSKPDWRITFSINLPFANSEVLQLLVGRGLGEGLASLGVRM